MTKESPSTDLSSSRFLFRDTDAVDTTIASRGSSRSGVNDAIVMEVDTSYVSWEVQLLAHSFVRSREVAFS